MSNYLLLLFDYITVFNNYLYDRFINQPNSSNVEKIDKEHFVVNYKINNKEYKMMVKLKKGPSSIYKVSKEDGTEITDVVIPYLGPNHEWIHCVHPYTYFFPEQKLTIHYINGETYIHL